MTPAKQRALVTILIGLGVLFVGIFGLRTIFSFREFRAHRPPPPFETEQAETDVELIRDWMTIPFIGRTYHISPRVLFKALDIPHEGNEEKSIRQLNDEYYPGTPNMVLDLVKTTVRANLPPPSAIPPATVMSPATAVPPASP